VRRPCKFTEAEMRRAIRAVRKEGLLPHIEIMLDGRLVITATTELPAAATAGATGPNEWDNV
jgi:hypothetical protein